MVGRLGQDPPAQPAANPDPAELDRQTIEVGVAFGVVSHASAASTARENVFHSSRRTDSASLPAGVIR